MKKERRTRTFISFLNFDFVFALSGTPLLLQHSPLGRGDRRRRWVRFPHAAPRGISRRLCRLYHGIALRCLYLVRLSRSISRTTGAYHFAIGKPITASNLIHHSVVPLVSPTGSVTSRENDTQSFSNTLGFASLPEREGQVVSRTIGAYIFAIGKHFPTL